MATGYGLDDQIIGVRSRRALGIFLFDTVSRPVLGTTQPPIQWVTGALSLGVKRPKSKDAWSYTSPPQHIFMAWCLVKHMDKFTIFFCFDSGVGMS
jgi:hypothetical protein